jgi:hypothetical protein
VDELHSLPQEGSKEMVFLSANKIRWKGMGRENGMANKEVAEDEGLFAAVTRDAIGHIAVYRFKRRKPRRECCP